MVSIKQPQNIPSKQVKNKTAPEQLITTENAFPSHQNYFASYLLLTLTPCITRALHGI